MGIGLLFVMILLLTTISVAYINRLNSETKNILVANFNSLDYLRKMQLAIDNDIIHADAKQLFTNNLLLQQNNITEIGEKELTNNLAQLFFQLQKNPNNDVLKKQVRKTMSDIVLLNMLAIERKGKIAEQTASNSLFWITIVGTVCFIIALTMLFNLPGNIANPIQQLTQSIIEIAAENYAQRVHFKKQNEFGDLAAAFNTMAEKLEEYKAGNIEKLLIEKKRIETLINNMNDPVIGLDQYQKILFMNNMALQITGLKAEYIIGKSVEEIASKNDLIKNLTQELFNNNTVSKNAKVEPIKIFADNKESYFEKEIIPIKIIPTGEQAEIEIGKVILLQNITQYKELDFAKTNFIATVSHEFKTPISAIKLSTQLLENKQIGLLNQEQTSLVESIKDDAERLLKITTELLNITQLESGNIQLSIASCNPLTIVQNAIDATKTQAEQKHIQVIVNKSDEALTMLADSDKTTWVLTNLLSNAIKNSFEDSSIFISINSIDDCVSIAVKDSGQGIAPIYQEKIFDRYFRIPGNQNSGTGLGLSISKEFIQAQGGKITLKSELGVGSTFSIHLNESKPSN